MVLIVTYDVEDDRERRGVARLLLGYGERVQRSVFECALGPREAEELIELLAARAQRARGEFSVRCYPLGERAVGRVRTIGSGGVVQDEPFFLV